MNLSVEQIAVDKDESRELLNQLATLEPGDPRRVETRNRLATLHLPLAEHMARRFAGRGEPFEDLVQVATIGLIKSIDRYDPERGVEFSTYATPTIVGEIKRWFRDKGWAVRVPRRLQELRLSVSSATTDLTHELGRSPTVAELAEALHVSEDSVVEALESATAYSAVSLDTPDPYAEFAVSPLEAIGHEDEALEGVENREAITRVLAMLPDRERQIVVLRFFRGMTQSQIANEVGISQMHVSRLLSKSLAQLREAFLADPASY
ncbi:RNA polymerase sigma factor SigF [Actinobacteria bacterium YIM 96077]|uniref:B/F/G family RNA polymerase sigma-70 factor n=1 Tax=Phytoactinopolyspora halophila TaxID=1981511 RepID=A0A329R306_9ACTN|nr:RNA polymerase sigma factor SigF [Phytoactinopolyspora halophila]AYY12002.1 RNA polymerase sigma factor SigF [Actinobacteria bacterium YIM 96077]RAW18763.1 B/F/G family RNA polymerase sigma-70 factor [Phytoactinopolyspora halophila]